MLLRLAVAALLLTGCSCGGTSASEPDAGAADSAYDANGDDAAREDAAMGEDASLPVETRLAEGVTIDDVAVFQGTRIALTSGGVPLSARPIPVVALRTSIVRVYVTPSAPRVVTCELEVREGSTVVAVHRVMQTITRSSSDADSTSVIDFRVPAEQVTPTARLALRLVDPAGTLPTLAAHRARLPRDGSAMPLGAQDDGDGLHLVLVPLRWDGDGSGRLPDTSSVWLTTVRELLLSIYPIVDLDIEVHTPIPWNRALTFAGNVDFGDINAMLLDLRQTESAPNDAYYYAVVMPNASFDAYCGGSCVTGQSYVVDAPEDGDYRVGSGVDFGTEDSAWTLAHEVGHELGRYHAPCDTSGADIDYPYLDGSIGTWGWDERDDAFFDPSETTDFMGYCEPTWTSDYTWRAIFERTVAVSALSAPPPARSLLVRVGTEAGAVVVGERTMAQPRTRARTGYRWLAGTRVLGVGSAPALTVSESDERLVVLPAPPADADAVMLDGRVVELLP